MNMSIQRTAPDGSMERKSSLLGPDERSRRGWPARRWRGLANGGRAETVRRRKVPAGRSGDRTAEVRWRGRGLGIGRSRGCRYGHPIP